MLTSLATELTGILPMAQASLLSWSGWIAAGTSAGALLHDRVLRLVEHTDERTQYLARFFEIRPEQILPLPPATALWAMYMQRNREATSATQMPLGSPTLKGCYLIHLETGLALVSVHNLDSPGIANDEEIPDLINVYAQTSLSGAGVFSTSEMPFEIEFDTVKYADIIEYLLKAEFGYDGSVVPFVLLRNKPDIHIEPEDQMTQSGHAVTYLDFRACAEARAALGAVSTGTLDDPGKAFQWLRTWYGRTTSLPRTLLRWLVFLGGLTAGITGFFAPLA